MKRLNRLMELLTQNLGWKLLALTIALVVRGMVANEPELSTFATVGVEYKNLPENLEISSDPVSTVKLELRGPAGQLRGAASSGERPEVILDMSQMHSGERTFPISEGSVKLVRGVKLVRAIPSEVRFTFERSAQRTVTVTPRFTERSGYEVLNFTVSPASVDIAGPAGHVARVETVLTDAVNIPAREGSFEYPVNTFLEDSYIRFRNVSRVTVTVNVRKK
jgi:YbbR domain-containing protein